MPVSRVYHTCANGLASIISAAQINSIDITLISKRICCRLIFNLLMKELIIPMSYQLGKLLARGRYFKVQDLSLQALGRSLGQLLKKFRCLTEYSP